MSTTSTPIVTDHPHITDDEYQDIRDGLPKCPECGGDIYEVHFIAHQTHRFYVQIDGSNGEVLASSELYDVVDIEPNGKLDTAGRFCVEVECEEHHTWAESRLNFARREGDYAKWEVDMLP